MKYNKDKKAFSLAEVLITLAIIGIISVLIISMLYKNIYEKQTVAKLRTIQSILASAIRTAEAEDGDVASWGLKQNHSASDAQIIGEKLLKHMKVSQDCGVNPDTKGTCFPNITYKYLNGNGNTPNYALRGNYYKFVLYNGATFFVQSYSGNLDEGYINFNVDINGSLPPNTVGLDLFDFNYYNGSVRPNGAPGSEADGNCKKTGSGWGCAYYVLTKGKLLR